MKKYFEWLRASGIADESEIKGLSPETIKEIESKFNLTLPNEYKDFLSQCGRAAGAFARDIDILYPRFMRLRQYLTEDADEIQMTYKFPDNAFFFSAYQRGFYYYFLCGDEDKKIYVLNDGDSAPTLVSESFESFIRDTISAYQDAFIQNPDKSWMNIT